MTAILATNVIHATMHLASTMATIHVLLQPGGHIVFNEVQNPGTLPEDGTKKGGWRPGEHTEFLGRTRMNNTNYQV